MPCLVPHPNSQVTELPWNTTLEHYRQTAASYKQTLFTAAGPQELVRLPVAPMSSEAQPGFAMLIESYTDRMEVTMTAWFKAILAQVAAGGGCCRQILGVLAQQLLEPHPYRTALAAACHVWSCKGHVTWIHCVVIAVRPQCNICK